LIGVEQGLAASGTSFAVGEATKNLRLYTMYTFTNAPTSSAAPSIPGPLETNFQAHATPGSWSGHPTFSYRWHRCDINGAKCRAIPGAAQSTYTPSRADAGGRLTVTVAAGNAVPGSSELAWSGPVTSVPSQPVTAPPVFTADTPPKSTKLGVAYRYTFTASGFPPSTFRLASGALPRGLRINTTTGILSGTPTRTGGYSFKIRASNGFAPNATSGAITITVKV
jgi:hypothetical protein